MANTEDLISYHINFNLPWDIISGAQTSTVSFFQVFSTQWYLNFSGVTHFCIYAKCLHCFRCLALDSSASFVGHDVTVWTVARDAKQCFPKVSAGCYRVCRQCLNIVSKKPYINVQYAINYFILKYCYHFKYNTIILEWK